MLKSVAVPLRPIDLHTLRIVAVVTQPLSRVSQRSIAVDGHFHVWELPQSLRRQMDQDWFTYYAQST